MRIFIKRNNNGSNVDEANAILQSGWQVITNAVASQISIAITFPKAYIAPPIVTLGCAGDAATNLGYGGGGVYLAQGIIVRANSITTSGFTLTCSKADGTSFAAGFTWVTWIAVGV